MNKGMSWTTRNELLGALRRRYSESCKMDKVRILNESTALTGYHRKHGIRLLRSTWCGELPGAVLVTRARLASKRTGHSLRLLFLFDKTHESRVK